MHTKVQKMRFGLLSDANGNEHLGEVESATLGGANLNLDCSGVLSIEGLRRTYNSCSNCGVSWLDGHVSLDCGECGGYALDRPCPACDGRCGATWRRDVKQSHVGKQAQWTGSCSISQQWSSEDKNANYQSNYRCVSQTS